VQTLAEILAPHPDDQPPTRSPDMYRPGVTGDELLTWVRSRADHPRSRTHIRVRPATEMDAAWRKVLDPTGTAVDLGANVDDLDLRRLTDEHTDAGGDPDPAREDVRLVRLSLICYRSWSLARKERLMRTRDPSHASEGGSARANRSVCPPACSACLGSRPSAVTACIIVDVSKTTTTTASRATRSPETTIGTRFG